MKAIKIICLALSLTLCNCSIFTSNRESPLHIEQCQAVSPLVDYALAMSFATVALSVDTQFNGEYKNNLVASGIFFATLFSMSSLLGYIHYLDCSNVLPVHN